MAHHRPRNCIVPIHLMDRLANQSGALGEQARRTARTSARLTEHRSVFRSFGIPNVTGTMRRTIYDAHNGMTLPGDFVRGETGADGGPPAPNAVDEAYRYLGATYRFYQEAYGRNSLDDHGLRLDATVHYGQDFMNAYWDGQRMVFGDGDGVVFQRFTKCLEIVGHELSHGVVQYTADLEYHRQAGALNESFADVFGSLVKQYALKQSAAQADWLIGVGLFGPTIHGRALRSMKAPGTAYDDPRLGRDPQPAHMNQFVNLPDTDVGDWGGVHINSGIPNKAFYLLATNLGGNAWDGAGRIWYGTLRQLWSTAQFQDCAAISAEVARTLYGEPERQAVIDAWAQVGVNVAGASLPVPAPAPQSPRGPLNPDDLEAACAALKAQLQRVTDDLQRAIAALP